MSTRVLGLWHYGLGFVCSLYSWCCLLPHGLHRHALVCYHLVIVIVESTLKCVDNVRRRFAGAI